MFGRTLSLSKGQVSVLVLGLSVVFVAAGVIATRSVAGELGRVSEAHGGVAAGSAVRLICMIVGYGIVGLAVLGLLRVNLANLLVGRRGHRGGRRHRRPADAGQLLRRPGAAVRPALRARASG